MAGWGQSYFQNCHIVLNKMFNFHQKKILKDTHTDKKVCPVHGGKKQSIDIVLEET